MDVKKQIERRRKQLLVHRYIYYVLGESLITDFQYDTWERELRELVTLHPEIATQAVYDDDCPTKVVGSSNLWDYPRELQYLGDSLIAFTERWPFGYTEEVEETENISEQLDDQPGFF